MTQRTHIRELDPAGGTPGQVPTINAAGTALEYADAAGGGGSGVVETIVAGTGIAVDDTDPANPVVSATGGGGGGGAASGEYAWTHRISNDPLLRPSAREVLVGTWVTAVSAGGELFVYNSSNAQNDSYGIKTWLGAGTYALTERSSRDGNRAIQTWEIDDGAGSFVTLGTMDWYGSLADASSNLTFTITGDVARRTLRARSATRNASASGWFQAIYGLGLVRTS